MYSYLRVGVVAALGASLAAAVFVKTRKSPQAGSSSNVPILSPNECISRLRHQRSSYPPCNYFAMYSSYLGGIVTEPALMNIPLDDHMVHRGHGVFDTATLVNGHLYRLDIHIERLMSSARMARIEVPWTVDELKDLISQTCSASGKKSASVRFWVTAGPGDFSFVPYNCKPCFYCLVFEGIPGLANPKAKTEGLAEYTINVPLKPGALANAKSNNYLLNCLASMEAHDKGGTFGIWVDESGLVAEACVKNAMFVKDGVLRTPKFDNILAGTTARRIMQQAEILVKRGNLKSIKQGDISEKEAKQSDEMFLCGGDTNISAVTSWDNQPIGTGRPGKVYAALTAMIGNECDECTSDQHTAVKYVH